MDKNAIKKYAVWARRELISRVSQRAALYGITDNNADPSEDSVEGRILTDTEKKERQALIARIDSKGYEEVMEEVAYTWFNRFSALRFMEVNGYLPTHVRVFTDDENRFVPQIMTEAINLELDGLDMEKVYDLKNNNDDDELFKYLIITQCNALNAILPGMFQKIADYTELLFPDNLLREGSVIEQMITLIPEEDWQDQVQIIGWLYEGYNTERNEIVYDGNMSKSRITKELLPAATTIFTPDWPIRYMVENSLGRLWIEGHPNEELKSQWKYYLEEAEQEPEVQTKLAEIRKEYAALKPEDLKCIDPCSGSGHILAYMFDVLVKIYEAQGYTTRDAVHSIVENNIYGLDIDDRAAQLAYFSVMMKGRQYDSRFFKRGVQPHVYAIAESNSVDKYTIEYFCNGDAKLIKAMNTIIKELHDAKEYGSIMTATPQDWDYLYKRFDAIRENISMYREGALALLPMVQVAETLAQKYEVVITNPPYLGNSRFSPKLNDHVKVHYADVKSDLSMVMYKHALADMSAKNAFVAFITTSSWMFLSGFENLRKYQKEVSTIRTIVDFGTELFDGKVGHNPIVAWICSTEHITNYALSAVRLVDYCYARRYEKEPEFFERKNRYTARQDNFAKIPGAPVAYWVNESFIEAYIKGKKIGDFSTVSEGIKTGDNNLYLRLWHEVESLKFSFARASKGYKWYPHHKGGEFRKWYGNLEWVINWENDGQEIKKASNSGLQGKNMYFSEFAGWSKISSKGNPLRYYEKNILFDSGAPAIANDCIKECVALFNTKVGALYLRVLSPTLNLQVGDVKNVPLLQLKGVTPNIDEYIALSKNDWDSFETSWDFKQHPLIENKQSNGVWSEHPTDEDFKRNGSIRLSYEMWKEISESRFNQLKSNEEELNRIFIDIYGLQDELTPDVADREVTVHRIYDTREDVPESMKGSNYVRTKRDEIVSLISYAVGCMFGRYSPYKEGLIYAGGNWDPTLYCLPPAACFPPDEDNIIPICDDEYFEDDIVGRFVEFIKIVYGEETLEENLQFIADALGGKGSPREVIREYFIKDFYKDHCKTYQKRPIYWLFDSGKKGGFKALIYMHRYQPDTIARIRTDYVHEQQARYRTAIDDLENRLATATASERVKLNKQLQKRQAQATEIHDYEEKIHHLADQMIKIDLDDGVKHNYELFADVLAKIK